MNLKTLITLSVLFVFSYASSNLDEYYISHIQDGATSMDQYYNSLDVPDLYISRDCKKLSTKKSLCYDIFMDQKHHIKKKFYHEDEIIEIARSRYKDKSFLLYKHVYSKQSRKKARYFLIDNKLQRYKTPNYIKSMINIQISKNGDIIGVREDGIYKNNNLLLQTPNFETAVIQNNLHGDIAVAGIATGTREIFVSNLKNIKSTGIFLATRSDKENILSVYPKNNSTIFMVAYNLINIYNKGLIGAKVDFNNDNVESGWIYNYEKQNIGFYPHIYLNSKGLYISVQNSSLDKKVHFLITKKEYAQIGKSYPIREGLESESYIGFNIGAGLSYLAWEASSSVSDNDNNTYADASYDISDTLYKKIWLQGRVGDTQLALSYMQNEAQKNNNFVKDASKLFTFFVDINNFISKSTTLRISYEKAKVNGIVIFDDKNYAGKNITSDITSTTFNTKFQKISALAMMEKGFYAGVEYSKYNTPSAIGFQNNFSDIEYYGLDSGFKLKTFEILAGYDTASYAKRYETNYSKFYFQGMADIGLSINDISNNFKNLIEQDSTKSIKNNKLSFSIGGELQAGYLWQKRFKSLKGFGYILDTGVKVRGSYTGMGKDNDSNNYNELTIQTNRYDIWYGPYINYSLVF